MSQKANSRKKILIAAVLAGVLIIGAIVSIVLVLAASTQNITSNITISYNVEGVGARVSARYGTVPKSGDVAMASMTTADGTTSELVFNVSDTKGTQTLTPNGNIALSQTTGLEVVFEYRFQNIAESGFTVGLTTTGEEENNYNINETFYVSGSQLPASEYGRITESSLAKQAMLNYDDILYIYVKVSVANENLSAAYNKAYNWELKQITSEEVIVTLNDNGGTNGLTSVNAVTGAATPILETLPTAPEGQGFVGYYDATSGGTQYISKSGVGLKEISGAITLYAQYSEEAVLDITNGVLYGINPTSQATTITELNVPTSVTEIADSAFENDTSLTSVTFEDTATASYASGSSLRKIGAKAFKGCTGLTELVIPEGVTEIKEGALQNLTNLTKLVLPSTVTSLPGTNTENAPLMGCSTIIELTCNADIIPYGFHYESTGIDCLYGYYDTVDSWCWIGEQIPNSLNKIILNSGDVSMDAVANKPYVREIFLLEGVISIGGYAFTGCNGLTSVTIPASVVSIGDYAFNQCGLTSITFEAGSKLTTIGDNAFAECGRTSITMPASVTSIGNYVFDMSGITSITFEAGSKLTSIGNGAFAYCASLTSISIPESVTSIGENILSWCTSLEHIECSADLLKGADGSTNGLQLTFFETLDMPHNLKSIKLTAGSTIPNYAFNECSFFENIEIPETITTIGDYVFYNCSELTFTELPAGLTSIGNYAFSETNLVLSELPSGLTYIGEGAFYGCKNLTITEFPQGIKTISGYVLFGCTSITTFTVHEGVTSIDGMLPFSYTLKTLYLPVSLTKFAMGSFGNNESLTDIYYSGTKSQWNAIEGIADASTPSGCIIHCADGDITIS